MFAYNKHCISCAEKFQPSATILVLCLQDCRPMSKINLETKKFKSSANQWVKWIFKLLMAHEERTESSSFTSCFFLSFSALIPNLDDLSLGKVVASYVGQWNVPLQQGSDPCFLVYFVLHVFTEPPFCSVVVKKHAISLSQFTLSKGSAFSFSWPECSCKTPCTFKGSAGGARSAALRWQQASRAASASSSTTGAPPSNSSTIGTGSTRLTARLATMKNLRQSTRLTLWLDAEEASLLPRLGFEDDSEDQLGAEQILQIDDTANCACSLDRDPPVWNAT